MKKVMVLALAVVLGGCATPPGQMKDSQFKWSEVTLKEPVSKIHYNVLQGFRRCSDVQPISSSYGGRAVIDVYSSSGLFQSRSNYAYGRIELAEDTNETLVKIGVINSVDDPLIGTMGRHRRLWEQWAKGSTQCE